MVLPSDRQLNCNHSVGVTTKGHAAYLIAAENAKEEFKAGGVEFNYCPWCGMPVAQIMGRNSDED